MRSTTNREEFWTDAWGKTWQVVQSTYALKFKIPSHAALRRHIFYRDGFCCLRCGAKAIDVPSDYSGRYSLHTNTFTGGANRWADILVLDHIITRKAGGRNLIGNLQTLCETCNKKKSHFEDRAARDAWLGKQ